MRRMLTVSALFALALMTTATGQPPSGAQPQPKKAEKKPNPTDAAIAAALANDPDVKMAQAKLQLAEAELAKARQAVTLKVMMLKARIEQLKVQIVPLEKQLAGVSEMVKRGGAPQSELFPVREKLETAKSALALAETELKLLTGGAVAGPRYEAALVADLLSRYLAADDRSTQRLLEAIEADGMLRLTRPKGPAGPIPERIRAALDKPVKLAARGEKVSLKQALEVFKKEAGLDVPVREVARVDGIVSEGEKLPVGAWFQMFTDHNLEVLFLVREYGLLVTPKFAAPPDAIGVVDFWKQKPPAREPKETPTEPK